MFLSGNCTNADSAEFLIISQTSMIWFTRCGPIIINVRSWNKFNILYNSSVIFSLKQT